MPHARRRPPWRVFVALLALAVAVQACSSERRGSVDSAKLAAAAAPVPEAGPQDPRRAACAKTGHWIECQVRERLVRSGLAPRDTTREALPTLGVAPVVYRLGRGGLAVYLFADSVARVRAATTHDSVKFVRGSRAPTVLSQASVIENDNLLALLFSKNEQQIERVSDALTAGPPQP
jgi:hypothetical protein